MQTSARELLLILPRLRARSLGCLGWKDSTGVGKLGRPPVGLGEHEMRDSGETKGWPEGRDGGSPHLPAWLCVGSNPALAGLNVDSP